MSDKPMEHMDPGQEEFLRQAFHDWDAGVPGEQVWEELNDALVEERVWQKLDESLALEAVWEKVGADLDRKAEYASLEESYANWTPEEHTNGWAKLEEELSRERVWVRLLKTLNGPISVQSPLLKMVASTLLFMLVAFYTDYNPNNTVSALNDEMNPVSEPQPGYASEIASDDRLAEDNNAGVTTSGIIEMNGLHTTAWSANDIITPSNKNSSSDNLETSTSLDTKILAQTEVTNEQATDNPSEVSTEELPEVVLGQRMLANEEKVLTSLYKKPDVILNPRWSLGVGTQLSFINEADRNELTSSLPKLGWAGEVDYHYYFRQLRWSNGIGFGQYSQGNGRYTNGRYQTCSQYLNTAYYSSTLGYVYKHFTFYGGVMVNKLLTGYEGNKDMTTNVYNSKRLQVGGGAGIDYNFRPFKNNTCLGVNVQYQFVPKFKSANQVFNDIHGVRLQVKFSF